MPHKMVTKVPSSMSLTDPLANNRATTPAASPRATAAAHRNIEISYNLQSGSYAQMAYDPVVGGCRREMHKLIISLSDEHGASSVLDCGIGEGASWLEGAPLKRVSALILRFIG